ncbi:YkgJ family cysteine cluster protein [Tundrisphaera lichenicola]|uniref:YkgJ family cysteine cluster protein n=1 Tax=Tundrisphaera lichenicola TaxID=2029860 RepID=UPI003EBF3FE9
MPSLPPLENCENCGACCLVVTLPPFRRIFNEDGEDAWERLRWERPDLLLEIIEAERDRRDDGRPMHGTPCSWYDGNTRQCRHHELRPRACREFVIGGQDCRDARRRAEMD